MQLAFWLSGFLAFGGVAGLGFGDQAAGDKCFKAAKDFVVKQGPALIAGLLVTGVCMAVTGGAGSLGCMLLGAGASGLVRGALECRSEHTSCVSTIGRAVATDMFWALAFEGLGRVLAPVFRGALGTAAREEAS